MTTGVEPCGHSRTDDSSQPCGAASLPGSSRCLAHADERTRDEFLAGLAPGADLDMRTVPFTPDLLDRLLNTLRDPHHDNRPRLGRANFLGASFSESTNFSRASFSGNANFFRASFSGNTDFLEASFSEEARFDKASFAGSANFFRTSFSEESRFDKASFSGSANFLGASFSGNAGFFRALFCGNANFLGASFSGKTDFDGASFSRNADFGGRHSLERRCGCIAGSRRCL